MTANEAGSTATLPSLDRENQKTQGEIEAAVCHALAHVQQTYMGRGPRQIQTHLIGDLLVVRLQGVLTPAEKHLATVLPVEKGRELLKGVRTQLIESARPALESLIREITGVAVSSLHHDISSSTGEEVVVFTLTEMPHCREIKKK